MPLEKSFKLSLTLFLAFVTSLILSIAIVPPLVSQDDGLEQLGLAVILLLAISLPLGIAFIIVGIKTLILWLKARKA